MAWVIPPPTAAETAFRHSGWRADRDRVRQALRAANVPLGRLERFEQCGADCCIEYSKTAGRHRVRSFHCGDRACGPCGRARALKIKRNLLRWCKGQRVRFVTLTRRPSVEPLAKIIGSLVSQFAQLRRSEFWRRAVKAGAYTVEIKRGSGSGAWHVHVHCLCVGSFLDQRELSRLWAAVTGGSKIVDVREVQDHDKGVGYVAKYAAKGFDRGVVQDRDSLIECLLAVRGRRLLGTFGAWRGLRIERDAENVTDWAPVARFDACWQAASRGESWAVGIFRSLGLTPTNASPPRRSASP